MKQINLYKNIKEHLLQNNDREKLNQLNWLYQCSFADIDKIDFCFVVNDKMDICIRINQKSDLEYDEDGERLDRHIIEKNYRGKKQENPTIYYYENAKYSNQET